MEHLFLRIQFEISSLKILTPQLQSGLPLTWSYLYRSLSTCSFYGGASAHGTVRRVQQYVGTFLKNDVPDQALCGKRTFVPELIGKAFAVMYKYHTMHIAIHLYVVGLILFTLSLGPGMASDIGKGSFRPMAFEIEIGVLGSS